MIDALSVADCHEARLRLRRLPTSDQGMDQRKVGGLVSAHQHLMLSTAGNDEHARVLALATQLITMPATLDIFHDDLARQFGIDLADVWLTRNGYLLLPDAHDRARLLGRLAAMPRSTAPPPTDLLDAVRSWAGRNIADAATGVALAELVGMSGRNQPLRCFLACSAAPEPAERSAIRRLRDSAASVLSGFGILTVRPVPDVAFNVPVRVIDGPEHHATDERRIAGSDMVLVLAARTSCRLGAVASTAHRYRKHIMLAAPTRTVTPTIAGLDPPPTIIGLDSVEEDLHHHLGVALPWLEDRARHSRDQASQISVELARLRRRLDNAVLTEPDRSPGSVLNRARIHELTSHPELFAGATVTEICELYRLAGE